MKNIFRKRPEAVRAMCATFCFIFTHWLQKGTAVVFGSTPGAPLLDLEAVIPKGKTGYFHSFASARTGLRALLAVCGGEKRRHVYLEVIVFLDVIDRRAHKSPLKATPSL